tara:strand:+ start:3126 stop:3299 length:174 start_codon:yes stop_codon:yes gene_type:complete
MSRIEKARRNNRRKERLAGLPETILGLGLIAMAAAVAISFVYSPFLSMFWRTIGGGA